MTCQGTLRHQKNLRLRIGAMKNPESTANPPLTDSASGGPPPLLFIDEQERKQNPKSHLRTIVRSNARKSTSLKRKLEQTPIFSSPYVRVIEPEVLVTTKVEVGPPREVESSRALSPRFVKFKPYQTGPRKSTQKRQSKELDSRVDNFVESRNLQLSPRRRDPGEEDHGRPPVSPRTVLGEGRIDPFDIYPIKMQPYMHYLVDHCK